MVDLVLKLRPANALIHGLKEKDSVTIVCAHFCQGCDQISPKVLLSYSKKFEVIKL